MSDSGSLIAAIEARFTDLELIGKGSFGDVYKGYCCVCFFFSVFLFILGCANWTSESLYFSNLLISVF